jgi:hypothetical protein
MEIVFGRLKLLIEINKLSNLIIQKFTLSRIFNISEIGVPFRHTQPGVHFRFNKSINKNLSRFNKSLTSSAPSHSIFYLMGFVVNSVLFAAKLESFSKKIFEKVKFKEME